MSVSGKSHQGQLGRTPFNPVGYEHPKDIQGELDGDELASGGVLRSLSGPNRSDRVQCASLDTIENTSCNLSAVCQHPLGTTTHRRSSRYGLEQSIEGKHRQSPKRTATAIVFMRPN